MNTFMGLEIGRRGIVTQQTALNITGHNITNANTEGYSRQAANIVTASPWHAPVTIGSNRVGQLGTGSTIADIQRYRDSFIDAQIRNESRTGGYWKSLEESLSQMEVILNEPSDEGLRGVMDDFWEAWQDLSANPESESARSIVKESGAAMAEAFHHTFQQLTDLREDVNASVKVDVEQINSLAEQIAALNRQIVGITVAGKQPNDLMDRRDVLIDQLSELADIKIYNESSYEKQTDEGTELVYYGSVAIQMGGRMLVQGGETCKLGVEQDTQGMYLVTWADTQAKADIQGGELRGLLDIRGQTSSSKEGSSSEYKEIIPTLLDNLNKLAENIILKTNEIQRSGYSLNNQSGFPDGNNFFSEDVPAYFDGNWANFIQIDDSIEEDVKNIAAASNRTWDDSGNKINFGDGSNALLIAQLKQDYNQQLYSVTSTTGLNTLLTLPSSTISGYLSINYKNAQGIAQAPVSIYLAAPTEAYQDMQELASAIQAQLDANATLTNAKIAVKVRCDGNNLCFYSSSDKFSGVSDGNGTPGSELLGGATFGTVSASFSGSLVKDVTNDDFWRAICADTGVQSQEAQRMVANQDQLIGELEAKRQSLSGVSLDEEMTNMIQYQHAYNAASRLITTIDEELNQIINQMGLVGR